MFRTFICTLIFLLCGMTAVDAQNKNVKKMQKKADNLRSEIAKQKKILVSTQDDVNNQLRNLKIIENDIVRQKELLGAIQEDIVAIDREIERIDADIAVQEERVMRSKEEYAEALRRTRKYGKAKNKLHYIMAADNFRTMMRRIRYANTYMDAHDRLAKSLKAQIAILDSKKSELESMRAEREATVKEMELETVALRDKEAEQKRLVEKLKKESGKLQAEINKKQKELNRQKKLIDDEIERILKAEEEARRKKAAEEAKKKSASKGGGKNTKSTGGKSTKSTGGKSTKSTGGKKESYVEDAGVSAMSGSFEKNKKKMPVPITGSYIVVERFGTQNVIGNKDVRITNNGIVFEGSKGARARCVFDGEVKRVINDGNYHFILVGHGVYMTIYCNIVNPCVKEGAKVKAGDILGDVGIDPKLNVPRMQLQMRKGRQMLNPANWIKL